VTPSARRRGPFSSEAKISRPVPFALTRMRREFRGGQKEAGDMGRLLARRRRKEQSSVGQIPGARMAPSILAARLSGVWWALMEGPRPEKQRGVLYL